MEKIKDFLRNAAIPIAGGIIGAFIGMGIATLLSRYIDLVNRRMQILEHCGVDWKPEYGLELNQIEKELADLRPLVDAEHQRRGGE